MANILTMLALLAVAMLVGAACVRHAFDEPGRHLPRTGEATGALPRRNTMH